MVLLLLLYTLLFFHKAVFSGYLLSPVDVACTVDVVWNEVCGDVTAAHNGLIGSDQAAQFYPWRVLVRDLFRQGVVPLWNPYSYSGYPLLANAQSAIFYPINLVAILIPLQYAFTFKAVLLLFIATSSTYFLARKINNSIWAAMFAAIAYGFSSPLIVWLGYAIVEVVALFPLLLLLTEKLFCRQRGWLVLGIGFVLGLMGIAGHPETLVNCMVAWAVYLFFRFILFYFDGHVSTLKIRGIVLRLAIASFLGLGMSAVQLLPTWETLQQSYGYHSRDGTGLPQLLQSGAERGDWLSLVLLIWPNFFGNPVWRQYGFDEWLAFRDYNTLAVYTGFLPLILAPFAFRQARQNKIILVFAALFVVSLALQLKLPGFFFVTRLPIVEKLEVARFRFFVVLSLAVLGGFGLDEFVRRSRKLYAIIILLLITALYFTLGQFGLGMLRSGNRWLPASVPWGQLWAMAGNATAFDWSIKAVSPVQLSFVLPVLLAIAVVGITTFIKSKTVAAVALTLLLAADLFFVNADFNTALPPKLDPQQLIPKSELLTFLQDKLQPTDRLAALGITFLPNASSLVHVSDVRGYDLMINWRYFDLFSHSPGFHNYGPGGFFLTEPNHLLSLLGTNYLLTPVLLPDETPVFVSPNGLSVYKLESSMPRAYPVFHVKVMDAPSARDAILGNTFDPGQVAIIEQVPPNWWVSPENPSVHTATVQITNYQPNWVEVSAQSSAPFFLVLTDGYDPGWNVYINNQLQPLYQTNYIVRGVFVPAGENQIVFAYQPWSFNVGAILTVLSLLLILLAGGIMVARNQQNWGSHKNLTP